jgi:hypothetical protein
MTKTPNIEKAAPERNQRERGLAQQERSILIESANRHKRALEQLSRL